MALTITSRGTGTSNTGATTLVPGGRTATLAAGSMGVLCIALDNLGGAGDVLIAPASWTDAKGNIWLERINALFDNGAAAAGIEMVFYTAKITTALLTGDLGTITWDTGVSPVAKVWTWYEVIPSAGNYVDYNTGGSIAGATAANAQVTTATIQVGDGVIAGYFSENTAAVTGDADSTNGSWTAQQTTTIGTTTAGVRIATQQKVQTTTASTQSYDVTVTSQDRIAGYIALLEVPNTTRMYSQAQADIKATGQNFAQSQADIEATNTGFGQANAYIEIMATWFAQANADIKSTVNGFSQSQSGIKAVGQQFAQSQTDIKATQFNFGQSQSDIKAKGFGLGQSQADIQAVGREFGQSGADIKSISNGFAQSQVYIETTANQTGQTQADIKNIGFSLGQAQTTILSAIAINNVSAQTQADILTTEFNVGQGLAQIYLVSFNSGAASAIILRTEVNQGNAQASIIATVNNYAQAQARIPGEKEIDDFIIRDRNSINLLLEDREEFQ